MFLIKRLGSWFDTILDRAFSVTGAIAATQIPGFIKQYLDVLSGALMEARRNVDTIRDQASETGKTLEQFIQKHLQNSDPDFQASGRIFQEAVDRLANYDAAYRSISESIWFLKPLSLFTHFDKHVYSAMHFTPTVPLDSEGIYYAIIGMLLGLFVYQGILKLPFRLFKGKGATAT